MLNIEPGVEPELLNWENYAIKTPERFLRIVIYGIWTILTLYGCFMGIFSFETLIQAAEAAAPPDYVCTDPASITAEMANIDYKKSVNRRNFDFNCFC
jgi:hypothetical protein